LLPPVVNSTLADKWGLQVLTPAFAFWGGGAVAWYVGQQGLSSDHLTHLAASFSKLPGLAQGALLIAALMLVSGSGAVVAQVCPVMIRLLEGYGWPARLSRLPRTRAIRRRKEARERVTARQETGNQLADVRAEDVIRWTPAADDLVMPTRLGNILRSAEARPGETYGLDVAVCWPHLWLVLDSDSRAEITSARAAVNAGARGWLWGALFAVWAVWAWWALPIAAAVCLALYYGSMIPAARTYGDLLYGAFTLHRFDLYAALHWPTPATPELEPETGADVTTYLWRGIAPDSAAFVSGTAPNDKPAELRGSIERESASQDAARSEPALANWSGQIGARIETSNGRHADRLRAGLDYHLVVAFGRHLGKDFKCGRIDVRGGRDVDPVAFELLLDSDTAVFLPESRKLLIPVDGRETSVRYHLKAPQQAGQLRLWIRVLQLDRLLQAVTVTAGVDKPGGPI